ncbi:MAG: prepilin-type N-terminal cleavage/methylation domain-containing protein [bacterium]|nr:prepilin-type N-terminal cleavage/methylation domain-containing protein [bacterium]
MLDKNKNKILSNSAGFTPLNPARPVWLSRNLTGFTLIELLASVFIIGLVSSVFMVNYHNTNKRSELKMAAQKLASDIRLAQNYSLGSKTYDGITTPSGGWGVHFVSGASNYIIFADKDGDYIYNNDINKDVAKEIKNLPAGVTISSLSPASPLNIVFFPPDPTTYVNGSAADSAQVVLRENINNSTAAVTVNPFGLIDVN